MGRGIQRMGSDEPARGRENIQDKEIGTADFSPSTAYLLMKLMKIFDI
jgi:hypothetical protein